MKNIIQSIEGEDLPRTFLLPGETVFSRKPRVVGTLLGSCVAVCLFDQKNKWGGMNHYLLPYKAEGGLPPGKYGDTSISALVQVALSAGSELTDLVASIYGGGSVMGHLGSVETTGTANVGDRNITVARDIILQHRIQLSRQDVGGTNGRKIYMNTTNNKIDVRAIQISEATQAKKDRLDKFKSKDVGVLIVDDSATVRKLIRSGIEAVDGSLIS